MSKFESYKRGVLDIRDVERVEKDWSSEAVSPFFIVGSVVTFLVLCYVSTNAFTIRATDWRDDWGTGGVSYHKGDTLAKTDNKNKDLVRQSEVEGKEESGGTKRVDELREYLAGYNSPLTEYADEIIEIADGKGIRNLYKLVVAIAGAESSLGKVCPVHNAWGIKCGRTTYCTYESWEEGFEAISSLLASDIYSLGEEVTEEDIKRIAPTYAESPHWAKSVLYFWDELN